MKKVYVAVALILLLSCAVQKMNCSEVILGFNEVVEVQRDEDALMYLYKIPSGEMQGYMVQIINPHNSNSFSFNIVHPQMKANCTPMNQKNWKIKQVYPDKDGVRMHGLAWLDCDETTYCFRFSYSGRWNYIPPMKTD